MLVSSFRIWVISCWACIYFDLPSASSMYFSSQAHLLWTGLEEVGGS